MYAFLWIKQIYENMQAYDVVLKMCIMYEYQLKKVNSLFENVD